MEKSNARILMKKINKHGIIFLVLIIFLITGSLLSIKITYGKILVIRNEDTNAERILPVPNAKFTMSFIHSVHHTPVYETFEIEQENTLSLKETRFYSLGVGMPFTDEGGTFTNNNGEFILNFSRKFDNLCFRVSPIPEHVIEINGQKYPLLNFARPEERIRIYARDKWMLLRN